MKLFSRASLLRFTMAATVAFGVAAIAGGFNEANAETVEHGKSGQADHRIGWTTLAECESDVKANHSKEKWVGWYKPTFTDKILLVGYEKKKLSEEQEGKFFCLKARTVFGSDNYVAVKGDMEIGVKGDEVLMVGCNNSISKIISVAIPPAATPAAPAPAPAASAAVVASCDNCADTRTEVKHLTVIHRQVKQVCHGETVERSTEEACPVIVLKPTEMAIAICGGHVYIREIRNDRHVYARVQLNGSFVLLGTEAALHAKGVLCECKALRKHLLSLR